VATVRDGVVAADLPGRYGTLGFVVQLSVPPTIGRLPPRAGCVPGS
jgi:hypothetical protein